MWMQHAAILAAVSDYFSRYSLEVGVMSTPESSEEILQRFHSIITEEAPKNVVLKPDAWALLDRYLTSAIERMTETKPEDRELLFRESSATLRRATSRASARIHRARPGDPKAILPHFPTDEPGTVTEIDGRMIFMILRDIGPIPPFC